ncbi:MAG: ABC transporter substrate-binding protein [Rhizorhabdus sp.]|uniref:ABC transporter substrate-binding protein n=1 Tax=Rhizorhabdus sp. TaxID=1968843 RepID=UPI001B5B6D1E|nr:ABC transporter substrate-binding protein [Rhizorhabdus sp.]MBP8233501.1 ABC transporter substrate-binding protein [Rhizorhabdus sp.]
MRRPVKSLIFALAAMIPAVLSAATQGPLSASPPRRIVSLSLCADQYLVLLADPGQIVALNRFSQDRGMSWAYERAKRFRVTRGSAEELMTLRPDLVFTSGFGTPTALEVLRRRHIPTVELERAEDYTVIERSVRRVATAVGHPERGEALIKTMRARLAALGAPPGRGRVAAYYQRRGYLTGQGTLIDEMMRRAGLVNLARRLGRPMLSYLSIEQMARARPDFLLVEQKGVVRDRGTEMLEHPLLRRVVPDSRRILLPEALTTCAGPSYPDAMTALYRGIRQADRLAGQSTQSR